jgi:DNA modification methylase
MMMTISVIEGDCIDTLRALPNAAFQCCVTSPPYYGLRDYGHEGQIGLEESPDAFVERLVGVFREVRKCLHDSGTLWLNMGDSYAGSWGAQSKRVTPAQDGWRNSIQNHPKMARSGSRARFGEAKQKDLLMIPAQLALALRADGWWLRSDIIWHKPNPMPESVTDRPSSAHEHVFLLTKSERYFYDADAIREAVSPNTHARLSQDIQAQVGSQRANGGGKTNGPMKAVGRKFDPGAGNKNNPSFDAAMAIMPTERNSRNVWTIPSHGYAGAHFATMPPALAERCILAGSKPGDAVLDPFGGAGTTALVADRLGRHATICELNPAYAALARSRIQDDAPLLVALA